MSSASFSPLTPGRQGHPLAPAPHRPSAAKRRGAPGPSASSSASRSSSDSASQITRNCDRARVDERRWRVDAALALQVLERGRDDVRRPSAALDRLDSPPRSTRTLRRPASPSAGAGIKRSHAAVMIPSVPSLPISRPRRSYPATSLRIGPPKCTSSPGAITASTPVTQREVTPYLNACGPPALVARLPPICDCSAAPGSGGNSSPFSRASRCTVAVVTPASTSIRHSSGSNERTRFSRFERDREQRAVGDRHDPAGVAARPPTGRIGTSCAYAQATSSRTSSAELGWATAGATPRAPLASSIRTASATCSDPTIRAAAARTSAAALAALARAGAGGRCHGAPPVATGRFGSEDHADHEPGNSAASNPAIASAAARCAAVTPEPQ